jgi:hypothetical protein
MKKRVDVTTSVMESVARFERLRTHGWVWRFRLVLATGIVFFVLAVWRIWQQLQERGTLDLLALLWEDAEIIREFWQDTVMIFWAELPEASIYVAFCILLALVMIVWWTRKRRKIMSRRLAELAKRRRN